MYNTTGTMTLTGTSDKLPLAQESKDNYTLQKKCAICRDAFAVSDNDYKTPRILSCSHTYCTQCIEDKLRVREKGVIRCPRCKTSQPFPNNDVKMIPIDKYLIRCLAHVLAFQNRLSQGKIKTVADLKVTDRVLCVACTAPRKEATKHCPQCPRELSAYCDAHFLEIHSNPVMRQHVAQPIDKRTAPTSPCADHRDEKIKLWCTQCQIPICAECLAVGKHKRHIFQPIDAFFDRARHGLEAKITQGRRSLVQLTYNLAQDLQDMEELYKTTETGLQLVDRRAEDLIDLIRCQQVELRAQVKREGEERRTLLEMRRGRVAERIAEMRAAVNETERCELELAQRKDYVPFMTSKKEAELRLDGARARCEAWVQGYERAEIVMSLVFPSQVPLTIKTQFGVLQAPREIKGSMSDIPPLPILDQKEDYDLQSFMGMFIRKFCTFGIDNDRLAQPYGVACSDDELFIADYGNNRIQIFGVGTAQFKRTFPATRPVGVFLKNNRLYVSQCSKHNVVVYDVTDGRQISTFGKPGTEKGSLCSPYDIAVSDNEEALYVANGDNNRIEVFALDGKYIETIGARDLHFPTGLAILRDTVYVADAWSYRVHVFKLDGTPVKTFGSQGRGNGQFGGGESSILSAAGQIWVSDAPNSRVQRFTPNGDFIAAFGVQGTCDGQLSAPYGMATHNMELFVCDHGNSRICTFSQVKQR